MTEHEERTAEIRKRLDAAYEMERLVHEARVLIELELEEATGDDFKARWTRAIVAGDHAAAHRCYIESVARSLLRYGGEVGEHSLSDADRVAVLAEVERLRSEGQGAQP